MYTVTVVTDPPRGPHLIGSTVNLTCLVHPKLPEEEVAYQWKDYIQYTFPVFANSSLPYAHVRGGVCPSNNNDAAKRYSMCEQVRG